jgi:large subunit ribosomal protein L3
MKLIGKKLGMTSMFNEDGASIPVTLIEVGPCPVTQIKTVDRDGYSAVQIAFADGMKESNLTKPVAGHLKKTETAPSRFFTEFRTEEGAEYELGSALTIENLDENLPVTIEGTTKGRGFAGGMKRHGFKGHRASHGEEKHHRTNGSLSSSARLTHVWKGKRMAGHMGNVKQSIKGLAIVKIDAEKNLLVIKGSIPGHSGAKVTVVQ